jgi:hypothetical protein
LRILFEQHEILTHDFYFSFIYLSSEWLGSNQRLLRPERSALPAALHPDFSAERQEIESWTPLRVYLLSRQAR